MSPRHSVSCPGCGAHGWTEHTCPKCAPIPSPNDPHPLAVAFAWWPDDPEAQPDARAVYTATCGCGWSVAAGSERHAWHAAWDHAGVLDAWAAWPFDRPRPDAGPRDRAPHDPELPRGRPPARRLREQGYPTKADDIRATHIQEFHGRRT